MKKVKKIANNNRPSAYPCKYPQNPLTNERR